MFAPSSTPHLPTYRTQQGSYFNLKVLAMSNTERELLITFNKTKGQMVNKVTKLPLGLEIV